jgi:hypothetical protein
MPDSVMIPTQKISLFLANTLWFSLLNSRDQVNQVSMDDEAHDKGTRARSKVS